MKVVAVLLPVYHGDRVDYFKDSIDSLLSQSYFYLKVIVCQDGPLGTDLQSLLLNYQQENTEKIVLLSNNHNRGLPFVLNDGIQYCRENNIDFIARMDADDISCLDRISNQLNFLLANKNVDVVGGAIEEIDAQGFKRNKLVKYPITHDDCYNFFQKRDPLAHPAVMFRMSFFNKAGLYSEKHLKNQDTYLWYQGFLNGCQFANLSKTVLLFRISDSFYNRRNGLARAKKMIRDRKKINKDLNYGVRANMYSLLMFLMTISPSFLKKIAYKFFR